MVGILIAAAPGWWSVIVGKPPNEIGKAAQFEEDMDNACKGYLDDHPPSQATFLARHARGAFEQFERREEMLEDIRALDPPAEHIPEHSDYVDAVTSVQTAWFGVGDHPLAPQRPAAQSTDVLGRRLNRSRTEAAVKAGRQSAQGMQLDVCDSPRVIAPA